MPQYVILQPLIHGHPQVVIMPEEGQVWSLIPLYSVDSKSRIGVKKVHFKSRCQLFLTVSWDLRAQRGIPDGVLCISVVPEARTRRVEGPGRAPCQLKRPFKGLRQRRGSCKEELQRTVFPQRGDIALPFRQINDFLQKRNERKSSKWPDLRRVKALAIRFPCWGLPT